LAFSKSFIDWQYNCLHDAIMGDLRNTSCRLAFCLVACAQAQPVATQTPPDPIPLMAACTGRLSAVMQFQWLVQDAGSDQTRTRRDAVAELLTAATPAGYEVRAMALRVEAKQAFARLLHRARFGSRGPAADWAAKRAARLVAECAALMIS
jgi:hypothetical protein